MGKIIPIKQMWSWWEAWVVFKDIEGNWCDCTGSVIHETPSVLTIGNRGDHCKFEIPKECIEFIEEVTE